MIAARAVPFGLEGLTGRGGSRAAFYPAGDGAMVRGLRMGSKAYGVFVAVYAITWVGLFGWGTRRAFTLALLILPPFHFFASAARLADAGLNFWLSLLIVPVLNIGIPIGICIILAGNDPHSSEYFVVALVYLVIFLFFAIKLLISVLCFKVGRPKSVPLAPPAVAPQVPQPRQGPAWVDIKDGRRLWVDTSNEP